MIEGLKPYPKMKDSGVPWLGRVPEPWETERAKWLFRKVSRPVRDTDEVITCFRDGTVTLRRNRRTRGFTEALKEIGYQGIRKGDLVIHAMDAFAGAVGVADSDGKGTPVYSVCEPKSMADSHYFAYAVREMARSQWIQALARGIRERSSDFRFDGFGAQPVPLPPLLEQTAIVRFLAQADRGIRRLIRSKQKLITLLEEQKQAIIHRAVTCGLDPSIRLRPSGQEWIGDIPSHWDLLPNRALLRLKKEVVGKRSGDYVLLSLTKRGIIARDMEHPEGKFPTSFDTYQVIEPGDFVFCLFDIDETPRAVGLSTLHGMITGAYTRFACDPSIAEWVHLFYLAMDNGKRLKPLYTGLRKVITKSRFLGAKIPMPPPEERIRLVAEVEHATRGATDAISRAQREIDLLKEFRTRLISDVVTGRLDVRDAAARLPADDLEGDDPLDDTDTDGEEDDDSPMESGAEDGDGG